MLLFLLFQIKLKTQIMGLSLYGSGRLATRKEERASIGTVGENMPDPLMKCSRLDDQVNNLLMSPVTALEVKETTFQIGGMKARNTADFRPFPVMCIILQYPSQLYRRRTQCIDMEGDNALSHRKSGNKDRTEREIDNSRNNEKAEARSRQGHCFKMMDRIRYFLSLNALSSSMSINL